MAGMRSNLGLRLIKSLKQNKGGAIAFPEFAKLQRIGVVYEMPLKETVEPVTRFIEMMRSKGKQVVELVYVNAARLPEGLTNELNRLFICKKDIDWRYVPKKESVNAFVREDFDCVISFDQKGRLPVQAVSALSKARLKIGNYLPVFTFCHDLMIETPEHSNEQYISQLKHYLNFAV